MPSLPLASRANLAPILSRGRRAWPVLALMAVCAVLVLVAYRFVPGTISSTYSIVADAAYAQCLHNAEEAGVEGCVNFGFPSGAPKVFGLPVSLLAKWGFAGDGTVTLTEMRSIYAAILLVAFLLACLLFRRIGGSLLLGIAGATLFLLSPIVQQQSGYGALQLGFALIPGYLLIDSLLLTAVRSRKAHYFAAMLALVIAVRVFAIFLDGYSFIFSCLLSLTYFGVSALKPGQLADALVGGIVYVLACAATVFAYQSQVDDVSLSVMSLDFFRGAGVDVATVLLPLASEWPYTLLGVGLRITPDMFYGAYNDKSAVLGVFAGFSFLLAAGALAWLVLRRKLRPASPECLAIAIAGALALLLSLGPSLKIMDFRSAASDVPAGSFDRYLMPAEDATIDLGTGWIYTYVPGIKNIRALSRWHVLTRLAWVMALLLVAAYLLRNHRGRWAAALIVLALLETCPNLKHAYRQGHTFALQASDLYYAYSEDLAHGVAAGERMYFVQLHDGADQNEFVADALCANTKALCYNAGGDKASVIVQLQWPRELLEAKVGHLVAVNLRDAFAKRIIDVAVVPHFDLRLITHSPAEGAVPIDTVRQRAEALARDIGAQVTHNGRFSFIRPAAAASAAEGECGIECWRSWPEPASRLQIEWGPQQARRGQLFNAQSTGFSAIWVKMPVPAGQYALALDDRLIPAASGDGILVGRVSPDFTDNLIKGMQYPLYLIDREHRTRMKMGAIVAE